MGWTVASRLDLVMTFPTSKAIKPVVNLR
jgi:hypothetical protein